MTTTTTDPRVPRAAGGEDPVEMGRMFASGAAVRFVLLIVLIAASTATMVPGNILLGGLLGDPNNDAFGCEMAAGFDPTADRAVNEAALDGVNAHALAACDARFAAPWWAVYLAVLAVFVLAALLWRVTPSLLRRRRRLGPLGAGDLAELQALARTPAGLRHVPEFREDPTPHDGAVTWGRPGAYTVVVGAGLQVDDDEHRARRRSVVLHELAHLRNGDVGISQAAVALWRVFAVTMLLPFLAEEIRKIVAILFTDHSAPNEVFFSAGPTPELISATLGIGTAALVYLSRVDILRSREFHADHVAVVGWSANRGVWREWEARESVREVGWRERWRILSGTHPTWRARLRALDDHAAPFRPRELTAFVTGAAAVLVVLGFRITTSTNGPGAVPGLVLAALLVAGVIGLTARGGRLGSGSGRWVARWGLLLGLGFVVAGALVERPLQPRSWSGGAGDVWAALGLLFAAVTVTAWTVAGLTSVRDVDRAWRRRLSVGVVLAGAAVLVGFAFDWASRLVDLASADGLALAEGTVGGVLGQQAPAALTTVVALAGVLGTPVYTVVAVPATLMWLLPLGILMFRGRGGRPVRVGVAGAIAGSVVCTAVAAMGPSALGLTSIELLAAFIVLGGLGPITVGAVLGRDSPGGAFAGAAGAGVCAVVQSVVLLLLAWVLAPATPGDFVPAALVVGACILGFTVFVALGAATTGALTVGRSAPLPAAGRRGRRTQQVSAGVVVVLAVVLVATTVGALRSQGDGSSGPDPRLPVPTHDPGVQRAQAYAWWRYGGSDVKNELVDTLRQTDAAVTALPTDPNDPPALLGACRRMQTVAQHARDYFVVPEPSQQQMWSQFAHDAGEGADRCVTAIDDHDIPRVAVAVTEIEDSGYSFAAVEIWVSSEVNY